MARRFSTTPRKVGTETGGAIDLFNHCDDVDLVPLLDTSGGAGGEIEQATDEAYRDSLLAMLEAAMPVDAALLIHLDTLGPTTGKIAAPMWKNLKRPVFPRDDNFVPTFTNL
jgi:hypothetical protein